MNRDIIGKWQIDPVDVNAKEAYGDLTMEFREDGQLIYTVLHEGKEQQMFLTYTTEGNTLKTDQPSKPHQEETGFVLSGDILELYFNGIKSSYLRIL